MKRLFVRVFAVLWVGLAVSMGCVVFPGAVRAATFGDYETKSRSFALYNMREGKLLDSENADGRRPVASLTKIMTAVVVLEDSELELEAVIEVKPEHLRDLTEWAVVGLGAGQKLTVRDLLYALMLPSAGDAGQVLAVEAAGSIEKFAELMNQKAEVLGLANTHFSNPIGRDEDNYSTAADMAKLLIYALKNPEFKTIFEANSYESEALGKVIKKTVDLPSNSLLGAKTGFTYEAGRSLASTAQAGGVDYLLVVLGADWQSTGHIADTRAIYNYYGNNYGYKTVLAEGEELWRVPVVRSDRQEYAIKSGGWEYFTRNEDEMADVVWELAVLDELNEKVKVGDTLAKLVLRRGEEVIFEEEYKLEEEIEYYNFAPIAVGLVLLAGVVIVVLVILARRGKLKWWLVAAVGVIVMAAAVMGGVLLLAVKDPVMRTETLEGKLLAAETGVEVEPGDGGEIIQDTEGDNIRTEEVKPSASSGVASSGGSNGAGASGNNSGGAVAALAGGNCSSGWGKLMLINPVFKVGTDWIAARSRQLVNITSLYGIREGNSANGAPMMDAEAAEHLARMLADYTAAYPGHTMTTRSCFRARGTSCGRLCYATGTSDHHSGYTCDLIDDSYGGTLDTDLLAQHPEWGWLKANSYKYGFIDRFPREWAGGSMSEPVNINAEGSTGLYETWHYRYVGVEAASEIASGKYNGGKYDSLEHYLKASGKVRDLVGARCD